MTSTIVLKHSTTAQKIPLPADLQVGELAINTADGKLYTKHSDNSIVQCTGQLNPAFQLNPSTVETDFTLATGMNASSVGPITLAEDVTVTLNSNSTWTIQ